MKNENEIVRNYISNIFNKNKKDAKKCYEEINNLYYMLKDNKEYESMFYEVIYHTVYAVNYYPLINHSDDEYSVNYIKSLDYFSDINEFINYVDENLFYQLCSDVVFFNNMELYKKKAFLNSTLNKEYEILKVSSYYKKDIENLNKLYGEEKIMSIYKEALECAEDEKTAFEDAICYIVDFLVDLENEDADNYEKLFEQMLNKYHYYNDYLILNDKKIDEACEFVFGFDVNEFVYFAAGNAEALEPVVRDYLTYMLLPKNEKDKIDKLGNKKSSMDYLYINPNKLLRDKLSKMFKGLNLEKDGCLDKYKDELEGLKESNIFDDICNLLYIDNFSYYCFLYNSETNDEDVKLSYDYMKEFKSVKEYKQTLLEDDYTLLVAIEISNFMNNDMPRLEKRKLVEEINELDMYDDYKTSTYLFDYIDYARKLNIDDAIDIYDKEYEMLKDKEISSANATYKMLNTLLELEIHDKNNYDDLVYDLCVNYYKYQKYLYETNGDVENEDI